MQSAWRWPRWQDHGFWHRVKCTFLVAENTVWRQLGTLKTNEEKGREIQMKLSSRLEYYEANKDFRAAKTSAG
jgi:hypothetical protein